MRASDGDRDGTVEQLNTAFAEGRLTRSELDERVRSAYAARSWPQLRELTEDLPSAAASLAVGSPASSAVAPAGKPTDLEHLLICALLFLCPPAGICLWIMSRRRAREQLAEPPAGRAIPAAQELPYPARSGPHLP
jgi:hypothetical protein